MKNRLRSIVLFLFLANGQLHMVFAQTPSQGFAHQVGAVESSGRKATVILDSLEAELFDRKEEKVLLYKILNDCKNQKIDSSIIVRGDQPSPLKCMRWMRDLAWIGDTNSISHIQAVYDRHMLNFVQEWKNAYTANYYACREIAEQFYILSTFETLLEALSIRQKKLSPSQIFDYYQSELQTQQQFIGSQGAALLAINNATKVYNEQFRTLGYARYRPSPLFGWYNPYFAELKPFLVDFVVKMNLDTGNVEYKKLILTSSADLYQRIEDQQLKAAFLQSYKFFENTGLLVVLFKYCREQDSPELVKNLSRSLTKFYRQKEPWYISIMLGHLLLNERNKPVFYQELVLIAKKDGQKVVSFISEFLPKQEAVAQLKGLKTNDRPTRKLIERMIKDLQLQKQIK